LNALYILIGLLLGLAAGVAGAGTGWGAATGSAMGVVGSLWLNALKMTIVPLVVSLLFTGIAQTAEAARAGKLALRAVLTFLAILWSSAIISALWMPTLLELWPLSATAGEALKGGLAEAAKPATVPGMGDFFLSMIPSNPLSAAVNDAILPLSIFTCIFAFAAMRLPLEKRSILTGFFDALGDAMLVIIQWVLAIAPIGVFALAFGVGASSGFAALGALVHYVVAVSSAGVILIAVGYGVALFGARRRLGDFQKAIVPAQAVAISTQSSLASLPTMLEGAKALKVKPATADFVLPMAVALFRATGPAMNLAVAIYVAHWYGVPIGPAQLIAGVALAATTTMGAVSLPGSISFISSIGPIALAMGVPIEPLAILLAVEQLPDIIRTLGNVTMDSAVTAMIDRQHQGEDEPA
jgi:proton glutamate symport protein